MTLEKGRYRRPTERPGLSPIPANTAHRMAQIQRSPAMNSTEQCGTNVMVNRRTTKRKTLALKGVGGKELFFETRNPPRQCRICGDDIPIIRDREGVVIFDSYFHCPKDSCRYAWAHR